jgi:hypothetical protein
MVCSTEYQFICNATQHIYYLVFPAGFPNEPRQSSNAAASTLSMTYVMVCLKSSKWSIAKARLLTSPYLSPISRSVCRLVGMSARNLTASSLSRHICPNICVREKELNAALNYSMQPVEIFEVLNKWRCLSAQRIPTAIFLAF